MKKKMSLLFAVFIIISALTIECAPQISINKDTKNGYLVVSIENSGSSKYETNLDQVSRIGNILGNAFTYASRNSHNWLDKDPLNKCAQASNILTGSANAGLAYGHYHDHDPNFSVFHWCLWNSCRFMAMNFAYQYLNCIPCTGGLTQITGKKEKVSYELLYGGSEALLYIWTALRTKNLLPFTTSNQQQQ